MSDDELGKQVSELIDCETKAEIRKIEEEMKDLNITGDDFDLSFLDNLGRKYDLKFLKPKPQYEKYRKTEINLSLKVAGFCFICLFAVSILGIVNPDIVTAVRQKFLDYGISQTGRAIQTQLFENSAGRQADEWRLPEKCPVSIPENFSLSGSDQHLTFQQFLYEDGQGKYIEIQFQKEGYLSNQDNEQCEFETMEIAGFDAMLFHKDGNPVSNSEEYTVIIFQWEQTIIRLESNLPKKEVIAAIENQK